MFRFISSNALEEKNTHLWQPVFLIPLFVCSFLIKFSSIIRLCTPLSVLMFSQCSCFLSAWACLIKMSTSVDANPGKVIVSVLYFLSIGLSSGHIVIIVQTMIFFSQGSLQIHVLHDDLSAWLKSTYMYMYALRYMGVSWNADTFWCP